MRFLALLCGYVPTILLAYQHPTQLMIVYAVLTTLCFILVGDSILGEGTYIKGMPHGMSSFTEAADIPYWGFFFVGLSPVVCILVTLWDWGKD